MKTLYTCRHNSGPAFLSHLTKDDNKYRESFFDLIFKGTGIIHSVTAPISNPLPCSESSHMLCSKSASKHGTLFRTQSADDVWVGVGKIILRIPRFPLHLQNSPFCKSFVQILALLFSACDTEQTLKCFQYTFIEKLL